ncbi:related to DPH2-diphtheria toxin resistance protein [Serendipita indica DSM 11827]|uniref:2-(3-amino-3-carboxypropyl)histidine synthase subunit 2 n=1 Tax=Serendipita indica (strain DSM 11827) TaxID=1109443 RepID=G4T4Y4_SERID|nr:related to DPH2-diphtheria toxin resistance protein [Serendipita indica DSM 11827]
MPLQGPPTAFTNDQAAITRPLDLEEQAQRIGVQRRDQSLAIEEFYEIHETALQIQHHGFRRIAMQFPDEMLRDSVAVYLALGTQLKQLRHEEAQLFVLADTSYGSCCVDEVAAQHVNADVVVHYGHACLSPTTRLPAIYVYGKRPLDVHRVASCFKDTCGSDIPKNLAIQTDVSFNHLTGEYTSSLRAPTYSVESLSDSLKRILPETQVHHRILPRYQAPRGSTAVNTDGGEIKSSECDSVLFVGPETLALTNLLLSRSTSKVYRYDVTTNTCIISSIRTNKLLMRRYATMQRARDADVFGILVGTLGVASYLHLINQLRRALKEKGKKTYTISVGKLNPAKLANFAEIECFVLVACPENSIVESKDFMQPVVTPFELEIALGLVEQWNGRYILDFDAVLQEASAFKSTEQRSSDEEDAPSFSLVSGAYRQKKKYGGTGKEYPETEGEGAIVIRNQENAVGNIIESASSEFMQRRTWKGLDTRTGEDEPSLLEQGRIGLAKGYREVDHIPP